jgi:PAS domain S-box-containing protein
MDFERRLKNKSIIVVLLVLLVLCAIYFSVGIKNQKNYTDWQIQKDNEIVQVEINNLLKNTNQTYTDKIQFFVNNPDFKKSFAKKDYDKLYKKAFPYYSVLRSEDPYHFVVKFYTKNNDLVLNMDIGPSTTNNNANTDSFVAKTNKSKTKSSGFEFENSLLYYKIAQPILCDGKYLGCIEFGIREDEIVDHISKDYQVLVASIFNTNSLSKNIAQEFKSDYKFENYILHSIYEKELFKEIVASNTEINPGRFKYNDKYYYLNYTQIESQFKNDGFEKVVYLKDITTFQNQYYATVYKSILIVLLILISTFITLHFTFNLLITKFFNLQDSLDKRLAQKTQEIVKANAELSQIFNTTGNSMRLIDTDYNILRVNRTFSTISGISKEDAEKKKCYNVFPGPFCHTADCPLTQIKNGEERVEQDIKKKNTQGKIIPGILNAVAFKGQNGEILGIIEDFKDISLRVEIEETLKRTEQQFSTFMDNLPLGVFIKDENLKSIYSNKYMDSIFSNENCQNKTPEEIFPKKYAQRVIEEDKRVLNGEILVVEDQLPNKLGEQIIFQTHKFRYRGVENSWQIGGVSLDITQKQKTEHKLKILSNAIQHSPVCVVITNLEGKIQIVNPSFSEITGYSPEDVIGKDIDILNNNSKSDLLYKNIMNKVLSGKDWQGEFQNIKKNGERYWELASISPVKNNTGEITHFVVISEDITTRKKNEKELIDAKEKAEESNQLKTAFLANLSHEIRTPMNAIIGFSNLLLDEDMSRDEKVKLNSLINNNSQNLLKLIDDVIDISKIQSGDISISKSKCYLNKILLDLYVTSSIQVENDNKKDITLSLHKGSKLKDFNIISDPIRLKQILYNLIENAIKFTTKGFVEFGYTIMEEENKVQFHVIDSGIGISNDKFDMIYDLFRQADESFTREYGGTGIGLTIAKKLVTHLGGDIWVQSTPKQGTNIYFTLPLEKSEPKFDTSEQIHNIFNWKNKVVLVAEDIDINYKLIEEILAPTNARILWAKDGKEAVDLCLNNDNIDLVLMDIKMPRMDGFEATQKIKQHKNSVKIIGQTAYAHDNDKQKCLKAGFDNYISKPIKIESLLETMNSEFLKN